MLAFTGSEERGDVGCRLSGVSTAVRAQRMDRGTALARSTCWRRYSSTNCSHFATDALCLPVRYSNSPYGGGISESKDVHLTSKNRIAQECAGGGEKKSVIRLGTWSRRACVSSSGQKRSVRGSAVPDAAA